MSVIQQDYEVYPNEAAKFIYFYVGVDVELDTFKLFISDDEKGGSALIEKTMTLEAGSITVEGVTYTGYWVKSTVSSAELAAQDTTLWYWMERIKNGEVDSERHFHGYLWRKT